MPTYGATAPGQATINLDALFSTSLASYKTQLEDNISESNALFLEIRKGGNWKKKAGSAYIAVDLMYELATPDSYDGYDELSDNPTDGITQAQFDWRQGGVPIVYSERERKQNKTRLIELVPNKIKQAEMGFKEFFGKTLMRGSMAGVGSTLHTPYVSAQNASSFIDPLPLLVKYDPTTSTTIGGINQSTYSWWRNRTKTSAATTYAALLLEMDNLYNSCSRGPGGPPNLIVCDQTTFELVNAAYYAKYQTMARSDGNYPFENIMFRNAKVVFDQWIPDVESGTLATTTYGTMYMLNTKFWEVVCEEETDFSMTEFAKPPKGDSRLAHILFMGQTCISNRRKQGVLGKIARTLT